MNGGSDTGAAKYAATNGGWNSGTGVFTPTSGDPSAVSPTLVGQFASVFVDGATTPVFIGRVTARDSTTITVSTTAKSGTAPTTAGSGISINVGGVWLGPVGAVSFPFGFITTTQTNAAGDTFRVNFVNGTNYAITAAMTHGNAGPGVFQGCSGTAGDGGKATFDGGTSGASYILLTVSGAENSFRDLIFQNNGATGNQVGVTTLQNRAFFWRCVFNSLRGTGVKLGGGSSLLFECEAYGCGQNNSSTHSGFELSNTMAVRCISHDNAGSNINGFYVNGGTTTLDSCIADTNGGSGILVVQNGQNFFIKNCDIYNNGGSGVSITALAVIMMIENINLAKNGAAGSGYGISDTGGSSIIQVLNCGFGSGTQANTSGPTNGLNAANVIGSITYASNITPWVDPANGDFRINLAAAQGTGRGNFTQTAASYAGSVGYPDVGSNQHLGGGGGKILRSSTIEGLGTI